MSLDDALLGIEGILSIMGAIIFVCCCFLACRNRECPEHAKVTETKPLPLHLVGPDKSFGEPIGFHLLTAEVVALESVDQDVDKDTADDHTSIWIYGEGKSNDDGNNNDHNNDIGDNHNNQSHNFTSDPFAIPDSARGKSNVYCPPLPRYTTLPPANQYPIPLSGESSKNDKNDKNDKDDDRGETGEQAIEVVGTAVDLLAALDHH